MSNVKIAVYITFLIFFGLIHGMQRELTLVQEKATALCMSKQGVLYIGLEDGTIRIMELPERVLQKRMDVLKATLARSSSRSHLLLLPAELFLEIYRFVLLNNPGKYVCLKKLIGHTAKVCALCIGEDDLLCSTSADKTLRIWQKIDLNDTATYECIKTLALDSKVTNLHIDSKALSTVPCTTISHRTTCMARMTRTQ